MNPAQNLIDVFSSYDGNVVFAGLSASPDGSGGILGKVGWIFTGSGAALLLWGFVLRASSSEPGQRLSEVARTLVLFSAIVGGPFLVRTSMQVADGFYVQTIGGPGRLALACAKAAYAMPELSRLFNAPSAPSAASSGSASDQAAISALNDGTLTGYVEAFGTAFGQSAAGYTQTVKGSLTEVFRGLSLAAGFGSAMLKCLILSVTLIPVYLLLLASAGIIWFMEQLRYFLAVVGAMGMPLFIGMASFPGGHSGRQTAQAYFMNMVSLVLWPVAWALGHTGTIVLYDALVSLVAGTSQTPALATALQWEAISANSSWTADQLRAGEAALGAWFMGGVASLVGLVVGALGFALWVLGVSVAGPFILHRSLSSGSHFFMEALQVTGRRAAGVARLAVGAAPSLGMSGGLGSIAAAAKGLHERSSSDAPEAQPSILWKTEQKKGPATMSGADPDFGKPR